MSSRSAPTPSDLLVWFDNQRRDQRMDVEEIVFANSTPWVLRDGCIQRPDGRFFRIRSCGQTVWIDQAEIGLLGFVIRSTPQGDINILCHAKSEPGNTPRVQLAPTVQATKSNFQRVHGGSSTPFLDLFDPKFTTGSLLSSSLQSEQGTKFWRKRNRNAVVEVSVNEPGPQHTWSAMRDFLPLLGLSGLINTDARSVLTTCHWPRLLAPGQPLFSQAPEQVRDAITLVPDSANLESALEVLAHHRLRVTPAEESIWDTHGRSLQNFANGGRDPQLIAVGVTTDSREVTHWAQPLIRQTQKDVHTLLAQVKDGELQFLLRAAREPGLFNAIEFTTTSTYALDVAQRHEIGGLTTQVSDICRGSEALLEVEQSDEGGRFFQVLVRYRVVLAPEMTPWPADPVLADQGYVWVGMWGLMQLCGQAGSTTNELRSATSMMLSWL